LLFGQGGETHHIVGCVAIRSASAATFRLYLLVFSLFIFLVSILLFPGYTAASCGRDRLQKKS
jgi:hypothetical protein